MLDTFKKEFVVFTDPEIEDLHFGALPAIGRYFTKSCSKQSAGVFRVEVEVPKGGLYYHFYYDNNPAQVILDANNTQIGAKNWHSICTVGTEIILPVQFFPRPPYVSAQDEAHVTFKLVVSQHWIHALELEVYDEGEVVFTCPLPCVYSKSGFGYYERTLQKAELLRGAQYAFKIYGKDTTYYLGDHGTLLKEPTMFYETARLADCAARPLAMNLAVYHIFPDRFAKSGEVATEVELQPWGSTPTHEAFFGGNLRGITEQLPYLQQLGISQVYLTPIFQAASNHRYDCVKYTEIDPLLGTHDEFRELVERLHASGMRVILDIVLNHCGIDFFAFQDVLQRQEASPYREWFLIERFPVQVDATPLTYRCWWNNAQMPEFHLQHPEVRQHLFDVCRYWVQEFGIDGWRIDVSSEMDIEFLEDLRRTLQAIRPDITMIGENWNEAGLFLDGSAALEGTTNYLYWWKAFVPFFVDQRMSVSEFIFFIMDIYFSYSHASILKSWNVLSSHDVPRFCSLLPDQTDMFPAIFLQVTLPGTPVIYYGDECGLEGMGDPLNRACMPWEQQPQTHALYGWYRSLLHVYHTEPALNLGYLAVTHVDDEQQILVHQRTWNGEVVYCLTNCSADARVLDLAVLGGAGQQAYTELLTGLRVSRSIAIPAKRGCLLKGTGRV